MGDDTTPSFDADFGDIGDAPDEAPELVESETANEETVTESSNDPEPEPEPAAAGELGDEDNPYSVKNLPESFVTVKVNGEDKTVSLKDLTSGHMMHSAYQEKMGEVKDLGARAEQVVQDVKAKSQQFYDNVMGMLGDESGEQLDAYMEEHFPEQWEAAVTLGAQRMMRVREGSEADQRAHWQERQTRLHRRQQASFQRERAQHEQQRQQQAVNSARQDVVVPAAKRAMAQVGNPQLTADEKTEIWADMGSFLDMARQQAGRPLKVEEAERVMVRVFRNHGYAPPKAPRAAKKAPPVVKAKPRRRAAKDTPATAADAWDLDSLLGS